MILISKSVLKILLLSIWYVVVFIQLQERQGIIVRFEFQTSIFNRQDEKQSENCSMSYSFTFLLFIGPVILINFSFCSSLGLPAVRKPGQSLKTWLWWNMSSFVPGNR